MKLGLISGYSGRKINIPIDHVKHAESLGYESIWTAEAWGQDAVTPLAFLAAKTERIRLGTGIMQISARVPAMTAMTALTLAAISNDRFILGLGLVVVTILVIIVQRAASRALRAELDE